VEFHDLPSAIPDHPLRTSERVVDPYYDDIWAPGSSAAWTTAKQATAQVARGFARVPKRLDMPADDAWNAVLSPTAYKREARLNALGALDQWRTLTAEQLALFSGDTKIASGGSTVMKQLFAAGLADVGIFANALINSRSSQVATIYRPGANNEFERKLAPLLTYQEWLSITGGTPFDTKSQFDRHNLLAAELALRISEFCHPATVLGEKLSTISALAYEGWGEHAPLQTQGRAADLTAIREDGLRVALEITANATATGFERKVEKWATTISNRRLSDSGLVVIFVVASKPGTRNLLTDVRKRVARAVRLFPGLNHDLSANRIGVVDWRDWFPAVGQVHSGFPNLDAWFYDPTSVDEDGKGEWVRRSVFDLFDYGYDPAPGRDPLQVRTGASALRATPSWLRGEPAETVEYVLEAAKLSDAMPGHQHGIFGSAPPARMRARLGA
jgi:hypothetical protein